MQIFVDLDLRQATASQGDRSPLTAIMCSSQDTLELDIYFVRGGNIIDVGAGAALRFGIFAASALTTPLALIPSVLPAWSSTTAYTLSQVVTRSGLNYVCIQANTNEDPATQPTYWTQLPSFNFTRTQDPIGNWYWQGLLYLNTTQMATAMSGVSSGGSLACDSEFRYQLADGEIIHSIYLSFSVFAALLTEQSTYTITLPPPGYPDPSLLVLSGQKGAAGGVATLDSSALVPIAELPIDGTTIIDSSGKIAVNIDGQTIILSGGSLKVPIDGNTIVLSGGKIQSSAIITTFGAAWTTVLAGTDTPSLLVGNANALAVGSTYRIPLAGYYKVKSIDDSTHATFTNNSDPFNLAAGNTVTNGQVILPAQTTAAGGTGLTLGIGTVTTLTPGSSATAAIVTGTTTTYALNLGIPAGQNGTALNLTIGSVSTLAAGAAATATITGTFPNLLLNLGIPQGASSGGSGGGGLSSISDVGTTGTSLIYDGSTGKLLKILWDSAFNVTDAGTYLQVNAPLFPRTQQSFTMPAVGATTGFINAQNQGGAFLIPGMNIYVSGGGLMQVTATQTVSGQDQINLLNLGSNTQLGITNATPGATVPTNAWIEIFTQLVDATVDVSAFSLIEASTGSVKLIKIPSWLNPVDTGSEIQITADSPAGIGDMTRAAYDALTTTPAATPTSQVDQSRVIVVPSLAALRNSIDNGDFRISQRAGSTGTTTFATASGFQIDRWQFVSSGAGVFSLGYIENSAGGVLSSFPGAPTTFYNAKLTVTTASTPGINDFYIFQHVLEGIDTAELQNTSGYLYSPMCLHFYLNSSITGTLSVVLNDQIAGDFYLHNVPIAAANTWQEATIVIPAGLNRTRAVWGQKGLAVQFVLGAGTGKLSGTALDTWNTGSINQYYGNSAAPPTNFVATSGTILQIAQVSLNGGRQPVVKFGNMRDQLLRCQRFLDKSYDYATALGAITANGQVAFQNPGAATTAAQGWCPFSVPMYSDPTLTVYDPTTGASGAARNQSGGAQVTGVTAAGIGQRGFSIINGTGVAANSAVYLHYLASAEI